jgi:streptogramin lyase
MQVIHGTERMHRKLRSVAAVLVVAAVACLALPAAASAKISVSGITLSAGANSVLQPAIAPAPDGTDAEWFAVSGTNQELLSVAPTGQATTLATGLEADAGAPDNFASVDADGYDWVLDNDQGQPENVLYAVGPADTPSPGLNVVATFDGYGEDMTLGPDGALYISDNSGNIIKCEITDTPSAVCASAPIGYPFDGGAYAIGSSGGSVWFTDAAGELGSYSTQGSFAGPFATTNDVDPGTIVAAGNGLVYVAGGAAYPGASNTQILAFSSGGTDEGPVATGLGNVVSMTLGPDGNVWFLDAGGNGSVDELNIANDTVTSYPLPAGLWLPQSGWRIADGPSVPSSSGTGEVFFTGTTAGDGTGSAELGEVSGIPFPVAPGSLAFKQAITVSKRHLAVLTLTCAGAGNSQCNGKILLSVQARLKVKVEVRGARNGGSARYRTTTQSRALTLGTVVYSVRGGRSSRAKVKLSNTAYDLLEKVEGHRWNATVTSAATMGTVSGTALTMTGPAPPKPKLKPKPKPKPKPKHHKKHR